MEWMLLPLKRYAQFSGRSRRKEYWMFALFLFLCYLVFILLVGFGAAAAVTAGGAGLAGLGAGAMVGLGIFALFVLAMLIPTLAVGVRRMHDIDRTGWWIAMPYAFSIASLVFGGSIVAVVLSLASLVASIVVFVFTVLDGTRGPNRFGPDPKDPAGANLEEVFR